MGFYNMNFNISSTCFRPLNCYVNISFLDFRIFVRLIDRIYAFNNFSIFDSIFRVFIVGGSLVCTRRCASRFLVRFVKRKNSD